MSYHEYQPNIFVEATEDSPEIVLSVNPPVFRIKGVSYPEDAPRTYEPVVLWIKNLPIDQIAELEFRFDFKMLSSASHKSIYHILALIEDLCKKGLNAKVIWVYDYRDEDLLETARYFSETLQIPFEFSPKTA